MPDTEYEPGRVVAEPNPGLGIVTVRNTASEDEVKFSAEAWQAFLAARPARHDPSVNCTCEPDDLMNKGICEYRMLADAVGDAFNPPGDDVAEVAICIDAVNRARDALAAVPCSCTLAMVADGDQCARCGALGQRDGRPVQR